MRSVRCVPLFSFVLLALGAVCQSQTTPTNQFITAKLVDFPNLSLGRFAVGDLNGDGKLDVVAGSKTSPSGLEVLIGHGDGTFSSHAIEQKSAFTCCGFALADLNGDGNLDIVRATPGQTDQNGNITSYGALSIFLGNGDGTFQPERNYLENKTLLSGANPVVGDVNGDGKPDVAVSAEGGVQVYFNKGGGRLAPGPVYKGSSSISGVVGGADLNGDGRLDVVANTTNGIQIFTSNGSGGLTAGAAYDFTLATGRGLDPNQFAIGDLNRDGHRDLVVATENNLAVLLGKGDGTFRFGKPVPYNVLVPIEAGGTIGAYCGIAIADFRRNGKPDLVTCGSVYPGNGDGTFGNPRIYSVDSQDQVIAADFNNDHELDLLSPYGDGFSLSLGVKGGSFRSSVVTSTTLAGSITTADFNRDGIADVAVVNAAPGLGKQTAHVTIFPGTGKNYFAPGKVYPVGVYGGQIVAGDINGDGIQDLVVVADTIGYVTNYDTSVLLGNADGTFKPARNYSLVITPEDGYSHIADTYLADVNNDKKLDLIGDWGVALGNGDGSFQKPIPLPSIVYAGELDSLTVGDFNHDGKLDLAVVEGESSGSSLLLFSGDGTGSFQLESEQDNIGYGAFSLRAVDINKDRILDLILTNSLISPNGENTEVISVALGKENGSFEPLVNSAGFAGPSPFGALNNILVADFDRDGKLDVVANSAILNTPYLLTYGRGLGDGRFTPPAKYFASSLSGGFKPADGGRIYYASTGVVLDMNGDGYPDIVTLDPAGLVRIINSGARH